MPNPVLTYPPSGVEVIVDASNVARSLRGEGRLALLTSVLGYLSGLGYRVIAVADASLRHVIDRREEFERLVTDGPVVQAPAGASADEYISAVARRYVNAGRRVLIVSNDRFVEALRLDGV